MLVVDGLVAGYGRRWVVWGVEMWVSGGEVVAILGPNGSGKSTILKGVMGLIRSRGEVRYKSKDVSGWAPSERTRSGLVFVPERRASLAPSLNVDEHLSLVRGLRGPDRGEGGEWGTEEVSRLFPSLMERRSVQARHLSGGEQQMLALAIGMELRPEVLLIDEPSAGLAPRVVEDLVEVVRELASRGVGVVITEEREEVLGKEAARRYLVSGGGMKLEVGAGRGEAEMDG